MTDEEQAENKSASPIRRGGILAILGILAAVGGVIWGLLGFDLSQQAAREMRFFMAGMVVFAGLVLYVLGEILDHVGRIADRDT